MELLALAEEAVVGAVLEGRAIGGEVDAGGGEPSSEVTGYCRLCLKLKGGCHQVTDPHSFVSRGTFEIRISPSFSVLYSTIIKIFWAGLRPN